MIRKLTIHLDEACPRSLLDHVELIADGVGRND